MNNPQFRASFNGHFSQPPPPPYRFPGHFTGQNSGATTGGNALGQFFGGTFGGQFPNGAPGGWQQQQQGPISGQFGSGMTGGGWQNAGQFVETHWANSYDITTWMGPIWWAANRWTICRRGLFWSIFWFRVFHVTGN